jgi:hypothetical protein
VVLTPHSAWLTQETLARSLTTAVANLHCLRSGGPLQHEVPPPMSDAPESAPRGPLRLARPRGQRLDAFRAFLAAQGGPALPAQDAEALDAFSLAEPDAFWRAPLGLYGAAWRPRRPGPKQRRHHGRHALLPRRAG